MGVARWRRHRVGALRAAAMRIGTAGPEAAAAGIRCFRCLSPTRMVVGVLFSAEKNNNYVIHVCPCHRVI